MTSDLAESKRLRSAIEGMHMDMGRLNDLIGKSGRSELVKIHGLPQTKEFVERKQ